MGTRYRRLIPTSQLWLQVLQAVQLLQVQGTGETRGVTAPSPPGTRRTPSSLQQPLSATWAGLCAAHHLPGHTGAVGRGSKQEVKVGGTPQAPSPVPPAPVVASIECSDVPRLVQVATVVAEAVAGWHAGPILQQEPSRAVAARLALRSARHTSAQVLADPRASPLTVPALLRREVLHGVRALCCRGEWVQGWCQCWCCNPMSHMALTSAGPGVAVAGLEVGSRALGTTESRGGAGSAAGLNAGIAGSRALRPG